MTNLMAHLKLKKKEVALPKLAAKSCAGWVSETVECTDCHRCLGGRRSLSMHGCHAVSDEELVGFIPQCTMSFITTPKPFSQWGMGNEGTYMLRHVDGQTSLLCYSQMLHIAGMLFSYHNICWVHIFPKDSTGMDVPRHRLGCLDLSMSCRCQFWFFSCRIFSSQVFGFSDVKRH